MSTAPSLLPPNATVLEKRIAASGFAPPTALIPSLWDADTCPEALLPWLGWAESVDDWNTEWSEDRQRAVIKSSRAVHRIKGTPAAIKQALAARGQADAEVIERYDNWKYDGNSLHDGTREYGGSLTWAVYKIILKHPITQDQATELENSIISVTRNCCRLAGFDYRQAAIRYNATARYDGSYTHGLINTTREST